MLFLEPSEIIQLTKKHRKPAQLRVLRFMGIEHRTRPDGSLIVLRTHIEKILGGGSARKITRTVAEPDWSVLRAKAEKARKHRSS